MTLAYTELIDLIWVAPLAVIAVAVTFALALLGGTRSNELRRAGRGGAATAYGVMGILAGLAFAGFVVAGIGVIVAG